MTFHARTPDTSPSVETPVDRRAVLGTGAAAAAAIFTSAAFPTRARSEESPPFESAYRFRDLGKSYELWQREVRSDALPSFSTFQRGMEVCRSAACGIHHVNDGVPTGCHSGFLVSIPKDHRTPRSQGIAYIVTCDHARAFDVKSSSISIILSNGKTIHPRHEITEQKQQNGFPSKDLRIFECSPRDVDGLLGLPLRLMSEQVSLGAPVVIYEPIGARVSTQFDRAAGKVRPIVFADEEPRLEKFVLTHVTDPSGPRQKDPSYAANTGFMTGGQLYSGGSGSPAILFDGEAFYVGGYQVGYIPVPDTEESVNGELQCDGHVIHANNIISLLRKYSAWR